MPEMETLDFLNVIKDTRPRLLTLCQSFFDRQEMAYDAEDAVQETYLRQWQMRARIGEYHNPEALATMIAKNTRTWNFLDAVVGEGKCGNNDRYVCKLDFLVPNA